MQRIKTITSYAGHARFNAECTLTGQYLAKSQVSYIRSPYRYSPSVQILRWHGVDVVWFETSHRRYEVFAVPADMRRFKSDQEATDFHIAEGHAAGARAMSEEMCGE